MVDEPGALYARLNKLAALVELARLSWSEEDRARMERSIQLVNWALQVVARARQWSDDAGLPSDWGCGGEQSMTGRVFGWLGIKDGVGFAPGGNRGRGIEPKRRRDGDRPPR